VEYDAYVYDLDGTLVRLAVDWEAVREEAAALLRERGVDPAAGDLWEMLSQAEAAGHRDLVADAIAAHEREGARASRRLPAADRLPHEIPVGVCSLNCEEACRIALAEHGLTDAVGAVVGRDTVPNRKPDPGPLLAVTDELGVAPERTLFVGDSGSDEAAAERAGMAFSYVSDLA